MSRERGSARGRSLWVAGTLVGLVAVLVAPAPALASCTAYRVDRVTDVSRPCPGQNAEVEQAVDAARGYVYETWMGCRGIGFTRSTDRDAASGRPPRFPARLART